MYSIDSDGDSAIRKIESPVHIVVTAQRGTVANRCCEIYRLEMDEVCWGGGCFRRQLIEVFVR